MYMESTSRIITQDNITITVNFFIDFTNQVRKHISSFIYVSDYELGIIVIGNPEGRINSEDVTTCRVVEFEKRDI